MRLGFLDGLRGWGAVVVVLFHVFHEGLPVGAKIEWLPFFLPFNAGNAIFVFFLVSGFALSIGYLSKGDLRSWIRVAAGRYVRLAVPVLGACAIMHIALATGVLRPPSERLPIFQDMLTFQPSIEHLFRFALLDVFLNYDFSGTYIGALWTMSIELWGSVIVLMGVLLLRELPGRIAILVLCSVALAFSQQQSVSLLALFPAGVAIAEAYRAGWLEGIGAKPGAVLLAVGVAAPFFLPQTVWAGSAASIAFVVGVIAWGPARSFAEGKLSSRLGAISFPLYLVHGPVMWIVGEPLMRHFGQDMAARLAIDVAIVALSFATAVAFLPVNWLAIRLAHAMGNAAVRLFERATLRFA